MPASEDVLRIRLTFGVTHKVDFHRFRSLYREGIAFRINWPAQSMKYLGKRVQIRTQLNIGLLILRRVVWYAVRYTKIRLQPRAVNLA